MLTPKDETQNSISEIESRNREIDNKQSEYLYLVSEMLNWAMRDEGCAKILVEAHQDMKDKIDTDAFLNELKNL